MKTILIVAAICLLTGGGIGSVATLRISKAVKPTIEIPACPACPNLSCPPSTEVKLQTLDMDALKRIKGDFVYNPSLSNVSIKIEAKDSLLLKQLLKQAK
jgi:hypothetical protein